MMMIGIVWKKILVTMVLLSPMVTSFVLLGKPKAATSKLWMGGDSDENGMVKKLREQAEKLRLEVSQLEGEKEKVKQVEEEQRNQVNAEKKEKRLRYSAEIPILKGDGNEVVERVDFPPIIKNNQSFIVAVEASLPLGIILGEDIPGILQVDEVAENSNGEIAGIKVGDIVRATTACQVTMTQPTWQLIAGGIGQPQTTRMMFTADRKPFEEVMEAIASNRMDPMERPIVLVLERPEQK